MQAARHQQVLDYLTRHRWLAVDDAVRLFDASPATVRRDFNVLAEQGLVERVRGGIHLAGHERMLPWETRQQRAVPAKTAIAATAARLVRENNVVMIDGGTTTALLGDQLPEIPLRIITNSVELAVRLNTRNIASIELHLTGGRLVYDGGLLLGPDATRALANYQADLAFLSVSGITADGIYNSGDLVADFQRQMIAHAKHVAVLADHTKIGHDDMCRVAPLSSIDHLITDHLAELDPFANSNLQITRAQ